MAVIPAQAGIQFSPPGFRVSRCSPGMTEGVVFVIPAKAGIQGMRHRVGFVSEQRSEAIFVWKRDCFVAGVYPELAEGTPRNDTKNLSARTTKTAT